MRRVNKPGRKSSVILGQLSQKIHRLHESTPRIMARRQAVDAKLSFELVSIRYTVVLKACFLSKASFIFRAALAGPKKEIFANAQCPL